MGGVHGESGGDTGGGDGEEIDGGELGSCMMFWQWTRILTQLN